MSRLNFPLIKRLRLQVVRSRRQSTSGHCQLKIILYIRTLLELSVVIPIRISVDLTQNNTLNSIIEQDYRGIKALTNLRVIFWLFNTA